MLGSAEALRDETGDTIGDVTGDDMVDDAAELSDNEESAQHVSQLEMPDCSSDTDEADEFDVRSGRE